MSKTGEFRIMLSLLDDPHDDEWTDGGAVIAETAVDAEERYWRDLESSGIGRSFLRLAAYALD